MKKAIRIKQELYLNFFKELTMKILSLKAALQKITQ